MHTRVVYLTPDGVERFMAELQELISVCRPEITERLRQARDCTRGDDADEFNQVKADQGFVEGRILELETFVGNRTSHRRRPAGLTTRAGSGRLER